LKADSEDCAGTGLEWTVEAARTTALDGSSIAIRQQAKATGLGAVCIPGEGLQSSALQQPFGAGLGSVLVRLYRDTRVAATAQMPEVPAR